MRFPRMLTMCVVVLILATSALSSSALVRAAPASSNPVLDWNATALQAIAADKLSPADAIRTITLVHVAIYDAVQTISAASPSASLTVNGKSLYGIPTGASLDSATAAAARTVLLGLTPNQRSMIDAAYAASLAQIPDWTATLEGSVVGTWIGQAILAWRSHDGSDAVIAYQEPSRPGIFQPVPPATASAQPWATTQPMVLQSPNQFLPGPPPALTSTQYAADYNEIKSLGAATSTTRTADQTQVALFWLDDDSYMWNLVARSLAAEKHLTLVQSARLFAEMNVAMMDGTIAVFNAKYTYDFWRPQAAIRAGDEDGNPATVGDPSWTSLRPAPPHPDYPAAHPTSGGTASTVLASVFGDASSFNFTTRTAPGGVTRTYTSFSQAAEEEAASRVYVGFHFRTSVNAGLKLGREVGAWTITHFPAVIPSNSASERGSNGRPEAETPVSTAKGGLPQNVHGESPMMVPRATAA
jgi:PAP2 superfamily